MSSYFNNASSIDFSKIEGSSSINDTFERRGSGNAPQKEEQKKEEEKSEKINDFLERSTQLSASLDSLAVLNFPFVKKALKKAREEKISEVEIDNSIKFKNPFLSMTLKKVIN